MITVQIKPNELEAIALAASTEGARYYLKGVCFESNGAMIATDGHRLHSINTLINKPEGECFIMGSDDIKNAISMAKSQAKTVAKALRDKIVIELTHDIVKITCAIMLKDETTSTSIEKANFGCMAIDGNFPDWRRVMPIENADTIKATSFSAQYMADFGKAAKLLGSNMQQVITTFISPTSPIVITLSPKVSETFKGILMPMAF